MPVRVKNDTTGHEYTVARPSKGETEVDKPALDRNGRWAAPKYHVLPRSDASKATPAPAPATPAEATPATPATNPEAKEATA